MDKSICFLGHRKIKITDDLIKKLESKIEELIDKCAVKRFLFGSKSEFDKLCYHIVTKIKEKKKEIVRVVYTCSSEKAIKEGDKEKYENIFRYILKKEINIMTFDEEVEYKNKNVAGKGSYVERNMAMIDDSDICIVYYDSTYLPQMRKRSKNSVVEYQPKSGTAIAVEYAKRKKKKIINFYENLFCEE